MAPLQVLFEFGSSAGVERLVQVVSQLFEKIRAIHFLLSPVLRFLKYLFRRSRNCKRALSSRDLTAGILSSRASAVSSVDNPSTSRSTNTVRKLDGSPWIVLVKMSRSSDWE